MAENSEGGSGVDENDRDNNNNNFLPVRDDADRCKPRGLSAAETVAGARRGPTAHRTVALVRARLRHAPARTAHTDAADAYVPWSLRPRDPAVRKSFVRSPPPCETAGSPETRIFAIFLFLYHICNNNSRHPQKPKLRSVL